MGRVWVVPLRREPKATLDEVSAYSFGRVDVFDLSGVQYLITRQPTFTAHLLYISSFTLQARMAPSATVNNHENGGLTVGKDGKQTIETAGGVYYKKSPEEKAKLVYERALNAIKANLSRMTPLKALLEIDMGSSDGPFYLDAREDPKLVATADGEPDCQLKIKPDYIVQFAQGNLEPRYGLLRGLWRSSDLFLASLTDL